MSTLDPQFYMKPAALCRIAMSGGFGFATGCTGRINVTNVVRNGAGDYTITTSVAFPLVRGWQATVTMIGNVPAAGYGASLTQLTGTTWNLRATNNTALNDIGSFQVKIDAVVGDV